MTRRLGQQFQQVSSCGRRCLSSAVFEAEFQEKKYRRLTRTEIRRMKVAELREVLAQNGVEGNSTWTKPKLVEEAFRVFGHNAKTNPIDKPKPKKAPDKRQSKTAEDNLTLRDKENEETESDHDEEIDFSFMSMWYHTLDDIIEGEPQQRPNPKKKQEIYGRIIDTARLSVELAYEHNNALVGAMAQAGGDATAAERWLRGWWKLFQAQGYAPAWWNEDDTKTMMLLAQRRDGKHFINRCIDPLKFKKTIGSEEYSLLLMVATEVHRFLSERPDQSLDENPDPVMFSQETLRVAEKVLGDETMAELRKMSIEEYETEQEYKSMERQGIAFRQEEGHWWGESTSEKPEQCYKRLIDGARYGATLSSEQGRYVGGILDAMESQQLQEQQQEGGEEEENVHQVEAGPNARDHLKRYLDQLKGVNDQKIDNMPPWWNDRHEEAMWAMALNNQGDHFIGHCVEKEDLDDYLYRGDKGAIHKVKLLANVAVEMERDDSSLNDMFDTSSLFGEQEYVAKGKAG